MAAPATPSKLKYVPPEALLTSIRDGQSFLLLTHIYPDGDGIGSELALARGLRALGKKTTILNAHPAAQKYRFLDDEGWIHVVDGEPGETEQRLIEAADHVLILDTSDPERLGRLQRPLSESPAPTLVVDHHLCSHFDDFDLVWSEPTSPATGNLVLNLLQSLEVEITQRIVEPLLVALGTDTGWFRFANASPAAFTAAAELVAAGADPESLYRRCFETSSRSRLRLLGELMAQVEGIEDDRIVYGFLRREMLERNGVAYEETDGFIDALKGVQSAEIILLLVELSDGRYKVSLRSKGEVEIHSVAASFGGGGHAKAAGCRLQGSEEEVLSKILDVARGVLPANSAK